MTGGRGADTEQAEPAGGGMTVCHPVGSGGGRPFPGISKALTSKHGVQFTSS